MAALDEERARLRAKIATSPEADRAGWQRQVQLTDASYGRLRKRLSLLSAVIGRTAVAHRGELASIVAQINERLALGEPCYSMTAVFDPIEAGFVVIAIYGTKA